MTSRSATPESHPGRAAQGHRAPYRSYIMPIKYALLLLYRHCARIDQRPGTAPETQCALLLTMVSVANGYCPLLLSFTVCSLSRRGNTRGGLLAFSGPRLSFWCLPRMTGTRSARLPAPLYSHPRAAVGLRFSPLLHLTLDKPRRPSHKLIPVPRATRFHYQLSSATFSIMVFGILGMYAVQCPSGPYPDDLFQLF